MKGFFLRGGEKSFPLGDVCTARRMREGLAPAFHGRQKSVQKLIYSKAVWQEREQERDGAEEDGGVMETGKGVSWR